jgi:hypothetical protein
MNNNAEFIRIIDDAVNILNKYKIKHNEGELKFTLYNELLGQLFEMRENLVSDISFKGTTMLGTTYIISDYNFPEEIVKAMIKIDHYFMEKYKY